MSRASLGFTIILVKVSAKALKIILLPPRPPISNPYGDDYNHSYSDFPSPFGHASRPALVQNTTVRPRVTS